MPLTTLSFTNVGPFDAVEFEFDEHVNVFTGPNNSGKSTTLWVLGEALVYPFDLPRKLLKPAQSEIRLHVEVDTKSIGFSSMLPIGHGGNGNRWTKKKMDEYMTLLETMGFTTFIPALRHTTDFRSRGPMAGGRRIDEIDAIQGMSLEDAERQKFFRQYVETIDRPIHGGLISSGNDLPEFKKRLQLVKTSSTLVNDVMVTQKIIELDYAAYRKRQPSIIKTIEKIASIASEITEGFPIEFLGVGEDDEGLFSQFRTPDGDIPLNVLSQGTQSIIQWLSYLLIGYAEYYEYPPDLEDKPGILIIDEIDAHLHPSWQRRIIPALRKHFPNLQIFCSTHSPLMLAGLKQGQIQLLRRDEEGKVTVSRNETDIVGWSADEILRSFLEVPSPTDLGTAVHLARLEQLRGKERLSKQEADELEKLRRTVNADLLQGPAASQVEHLTEMLKQAKDEFAQRPKPSRSTRTSTTRRQRTSG